jgi:putative ABC transport system permease protein
MESVLRDVRYGTRSLLKSPALTGVSILALTLGIGLTTTMFSIVYGALMRGLPFERSERIMHLERNHLARGQESIEVPIHDYVDWRAQQRSFEALAAFYTGTVNISGTEKPERYDGAFITANAFGLLRTRAYLGRTFREGEDAPGAEPVVLLGYALWRDRYASDPDIVGKTIRANGEPMTVVGVMPDKFEFPIRQAVWLPLRMDPLKLKRGEGMTLEVIGRLKDGVTVDQAVLEMNGIAKRLALEYPAANEGTGAVVKPYTEEYIGDEPRALLFTMLGAVAFVLLIACANVANLLLGRAAHRSKEVGIRTALGASRRAVVLQFLTESLLLAVTGGILGLGVAYAGVRWFNASLVDTNPPFWIDIRVDMVALFFVLGVAVLSSIVAGLLPALQASRADISEILKDESRGASSFRIGRMSRVLVVFEIALSCGLLVAAGLMIKSVTRLRQMDFGFSPAGLFTARVGLPEAKYPSDTTQVQFFEELAARVTALPGVTSAALTSNLPVLGSARPSFAREGVAYAKKQDYPRARRVMVSPTFFATLGVQLREGRGIAEQDRKGSLPVAVVNTSFAKKHFGGESPLGRRIRLGEEDSEEPWMTIVGVAPDLYAGEADNEDPEAMYVSFAQQPARFMSIVARVRGNPSELTPLVREAVAAIDSDLPIYFARSMAAAIARSTWYYRVFGTLFMVFGFVALFLASIGLYAVMAFSVARRVREMGVRMALGAQSGDVIRLIFRQGFLQIAVGMVVGLALAAGVSRLLALILFDVKPRDPAIFGAVVLVLSAAGLLACLVPARRATRVDPIVALRTE